jgi:hypothetical protein
MSKESRLALLDWYNHFAKLVKETRFSLFIVAIAGLAFILNDQAKDLLQSIDLFSYTGARHTGLLILGVSWCALQGWGWARFVLDPTSPDRQKSPPLKDSTRKNLTWAFALILIIAAFALQQPAVLALFYLPWAFKNPVEYLPRFYGVLAYALAIVAAVHAEQLIITVLLIASLALFLVFVHKRRKWNWSRQLTEHSSKKWSAITIVICAVLMAWSILCAVSMGEVLGAGAVVFIGLGSIIPAGSGLVIWTRKNHIPALTLLLFYVILISQYTDNHEVRSLDTAGEIKRTENLQSAYENWKALNQADDPQQEAPLVLVATAGGGLRAAYWTALTLGELERKQKELGKPAFHQKVFAISGVSGGSVGAMFYVAALNARPESLAMDMLYDTVGQDYLAPTISSMLFGDLLQRFIFYPLLPDRARALEQGWEDQFNKHFPVAGDKEGQMQKGFTTFWNRQDSKDWLPLLYINGTHEETGQRIITTPVKMEKQVFTDAIDFFELNKGREIRASTAAHNSARFSYVSPAGTLKAGEEFKGHIIDGGYFENNGAETLLEIYTALKPRHSNIIVIAITNDVEMPNSVYSDVADPAIKIDRHVVKLTNFVNEVAAPPKGLLSTREARGMLAFRRLRDTVCDRKSSCDSFYHFNIQKTLSNDMKDIAYNGESLSDKYARKQYCVDPPLGWVLSPASRQNMNYQAGIKPQTSVDFNLRRCFPEKTPATSKECDKEPCYSNNADKLLKLETRLQKAVSSNTPAPAT